MQSQGSAKAGISMGDQRCFGMSVAGEAQREPPRITRESNVLHMCSACWKEVDGSTTRHSEWTSSIECRTRSRLRNAISHPATKPYGVEESSTQRPPICFSRRLQRVFTPRPCGSRAKAGRRFSTRPHLTFASLQRSVGTRWQVARRQFPSTEPCVSPHGAIVPPLLSTSGPNGTQLNPSEPPAAPSLPGD